MYQKYFKKKHFSWARRNKIRAITNNEQTNCTFQISLRTTLIIGQVFSLMPVSGVWSKTASNVRFKLLSWKCGYSLLSIVGQMFITVMCVYKLVLSNATLNNTAPIIFYATACCTMAMFIQIARSWPDLVQHIARTEEFNANFDDKLVLKCNVTCFVILLLALFEHILSLLAALAGASVCYPDTDLYEGFVKHFYPWVFNYMPYSPLLGVVTQFLHMQATFIWNYSDLFIITVSYYLSSRLEHVNKKLKSAQGKYLPEIFWRSAREDYCRATHLVRKVDRVISGIILVSFANNLFFICLQLFNTLNGGIKATSECNNRSLKTNFLGGYEESTYFLFSLVYLISRSVAVSLIASQVNDASEKPALVLYNVPSPVYCIEVQRFLDQVNGETVALSGLEFFSVTRGLLLTVAGTVVTYELVMVQFSSSGTQTNSTKFILNNAMNTSIF